jgi:transcriptional regulator with XRE-family HTH domain
MGRSRRPVPYDLAEKLYAIRAHFRLTQEQMLERLTKAQEDLYSVQQSVHRSRSMLRLVRGHISEYEQGKREPPLTVVLLYARIAQIPMEILVDDAMQLPDTMNFHIPTARKMRRRGPQRGRPKKSFFDR